MKKLTCVLTTLLLGSMAGPLFGEELADRFPEGTLAYLYWPGSDQFDEASKETAFGKLTDEPEMQRFIEQFGPALENFCHTLAEDHPNAEVAPAVFEILSGLWHYPTAIGVISIMDGAMMFDGGIVVRAGENATELAASVERVLLKSGLPIETAKEKQIGKATLKELLPAGPMLPLRWGVHDGDFIISLGFKMGELLMSDGDHPIQPLSKSERFGEAMAKVEASTQNPCFFADLQGAYRLMNAIQPMAAMAMQQDSGPGQASAIMMLFGQMNLAEMNWYASAQAPHANGFRTISFLRQSQQPETPATNQTPVQDEDLAAVPRDVSWATVANIDVQSSYDSLAQMVGTMAQAAEIDIQAKIEAFEKKHGVSIREDLFGAFEDGVILYDAPEHGGLFFTGFTVLAETKADDQLDKAIGAVIDALNAWAADTCTLSIRHETYLEQKISYINTVGLPIPFAPAWSRYRGRCVMALYPQMVRPALDHLMDQEPSLLDNPDFVRARSVIPPKSDTICYSNTKSSTRLLYTIGMPIAQAFLGMGQKYGFEMDISALPSAKVLTRHLFAGVTGSVTTKEGIRTVSYAPLPAQIPAAAATAVATAPVAVAGLGASILLPSLARARALSKRAVSAANLKGIGFAVYAYADEHGDKMPPDLQTLVDAEIISEKSLIAPADSLKSGCSYIWIAGQTTNADLRNIVAYERPDINDGEGVNVLFLDGHVDFIRMPEFEKELAATYKRLGRPVPGKPTASPATAPR